MKLPIDHKYKLGYRPEIEGIRAIAILLVIAAHAGVEFLKGGFIGVDIFFVLSGYLITGLIVQEIRNTGQLDLLGFYARRLRRLLPALLFMLLLTGLIAAIVLSPEEQGAQATSGMMASLWVSNIYFAISDLDYFASGVDSNLYLHTWSLGVEEQFYLVWPLLILFFLGTWKWQGNQHYFLRLRYGMVAIVFTFLLFSIFLTYTKSLWGFYFMPSRAWQFALGAYVFLWTTGDGGSIKGFTHECSSSAWQRIYNFSGFIGLACIVAASLYLDSKKAYPGFWALLPSVGTALILLSIAAIREKGVGRFLSIPPMQWIGKLSYSWYLWHWPILLLGVAS